MIPDLTSVPGAIRPRSTPSKGTTTGTPPTDADPFTGQHPIADVLAPVGDAVDRRAQHPLSPFAGDDARRARVGQGRTLPDDPAQRVAAHRLDDGVAILPGREPRPQTDHQRGLIDCRVDIALGHARVDDGVCLAGADLGAVRPRPARESRPFGHNERILGRIDTHPAQTLDRHVALQNGRGQRHPPPDDQRLGQFQHDDREAGRVQAIGHAGGQVAAAAEEDEVVGEEHLPMVTTRNGINKVERSSCYATIVQSAIQEDAGMDPLTADFLSNLSAGLTGQVINGLGGALKRQIAGTPAELSLRRGLEAGVVAAVAQSTAQEPAESALLHDIFTDFFHDPLVGVQIARLLRGRSWDRAEIS